MDIKKGLSMIMVGLMGLTLTACNKTVKNDTTKENVTQTATNKNTTRKTREMSDHPVFDAVEFSSDLWNAPEYYFESSMDRKESNLGGEIKALYYRSDYKNEESYAFAYLGIPDGIKEGDKLPAILLVHGGGGTAYYEWVSNWIKKGYVALAMDLEGHVPLESGNASCGPQDLYEKSKYNAPNNQNYGDAGKQIEETWMHYATRTAILGNSLLHSLDYVDTQSVGVAGVSWGGVITSIITGYDDRFAFSIMIYGTANNSDTKSVIGSYYKNHYQAKIWDTDEGLANVNTPMLILAMNNDQFFYPNAYMYMVEDCKDVTVSLQKGWLHSQVHAMMKDEAHAFADKIVKGEKTHIELDYSNPFEVKLDIPDGLSVKSAYLVYTDSLFETIPSWETSRLQVNGNVINYELTDDLLDYLDGDKITYYYVMVEDNLGRVFTTTVFENKN